MLSMATDDDVSKYCIGGGTVAAKTRTGFQPTDFLANMVADIDAELATDVVHAPSPPPRATAVLSREEVLRAENEALKASLREEKLQAENAALRAELAALRKSSTASR